MIPTKRPTRRHAPLASGLLLGASGALAQIPDSSKDFSVECISLARVVRTEVLDEQTIRFHLRGQESYSNYLPSECPGLDDKTRFTYEATNNRLCNRDTITLLERGSRLTPGITCRLGKFVPASAEEIVDLTREERRGARRNAIEVRRVELDPPGAGASETPKPSPTTDTHGTPDDADN